VRPWWLCAWRMKVNEVIEFNAKQFLRGAQQPAFLFTFWAQLVGGVSNHFYTMGFG
jgi:hypothetical protein